MIEYEDGREEAVTVSGALSIGDVCASRGAPLTARNTVLLVALLICQLLPLAADKGSPNVEFVPFEAAQPILKAMPGSLPPELRGTGVVTSGAWSSWVQAKDQEVRRRLDRGAEDTLANLLRFGVTFTREYRIDDEYLARYGSSSLVNSFAMNRAHDLVQALARPNPPAGLAEERAFLEKKGFSFKTNADRAKVEAYLLDNLARERKEFLQYKAQPKDEHRFRLFQGRGISLDTNLWPDHQIDVHLRNMLSKGLLKPHSIRRIAIIGPGLDFANKEAGNDFYPPQTIQPFAVLDTLIRLGVTDAADVQVYTLDISDSVNIHIDRARRQAKEARPYAVQLPWSSSRPMSDEYRDAFVEYWRHLGDQIGTPAAPIPVPKAAADTQTRAVKIRSEVVEKIIPLDADIVYQRLVLKPDQAFDIVIGTNIFVYYGAFEQTLARANIAAMLRPGGYLLSNDQLPETVPSGLHDVLNTDVTSSLVPLVRDTVFCYQRAQ